MRVLERSYGIGKPMGMIMNSAPNAGEEGNRIWEQGKPVIEPLLSPESEVGVEEAIRNNFAFVQVAGMRAGESSMVANISTGLTWDRQTPMEDCAQEIVERIGGSNVQLVWFGPHKLVGFAKEEEQPEYKLVRMVDAPREAYARHFPHLARAQNEIQNRRIGEILDPSVGNGRKFLDIFNGEEDLDRAYKDDGKYSFVWGTQKIDDTLVATNLDNNPQSIVELAADEDTRQMLEAMQEFFSGTDPQNRYFIEFDFSQTASCVNVSSNAQHTTAQVWANDAFSFFDSAMRIYPNGETYLSNKTCSYCFKKKENCECNKESEKEE